MNTVAYPKTLFVNLNPRPEWTPDRTIAFPNLGMLEVMSAVVHAGFPAEMMDLVVKPATVSDVVDRVLSGGFHVVALGAMTHMYWQVKPLVSAIKLHCPTVKIVVGGYIALLPHNRLFSWTSVDLAVKGNGSQPMVAILEALHCGEEPADIPGVVRRDSTGAVVETPVAHNRGDLTDEILIWNLFDMETYVSSAVNLKSHHLHSTEGLRFFPVTITQGCPFACTFCSNNPEVRECFPYRRHSLTRTLRMIRELRNRYRVNYIRFLDELSFATVRDVEEMISAIEEMGERGMIFDAIVRVGLFSAKHLPLLRRLRAAGFVKFYYSLESGDPEILADMNKRITVEDFLAQKSVLDEAGISSGTNIIIGYPRETPESIRRTMEVCRMAHLMPSVCFLLPIPGTEIYDQALERGLIGDEEDYLLHIGEQQFMKVNMTAMSDIELRESALAELRRLRDNLGLTIPDENLICSVRLSRRASPT
ncbi:MAG: B12-binding domain-containing radical SAM protein [Planctomycetes bacterium]|nr:B12-binding domain-containing radical SAM protein [Planctomycetota bacterium]